MKGECTLSENKTRPVRDGPFGKVWRGWGVRCESGRMTKKSSKGKFCRKVSFTAAA